MTQSVPCLTGLSSELKDGRVIEEDVHDGDVVVVGVVISVLPEKYKIIKSQFWSTLIDPLQTNLKHVFSIMSKLNF